MTSNTLDKRRDWLAWLLAGVLVYSLVCLISLATDIGRPFPGFLTYHNLIVKRLDIVRNAPAWWWGVTVDEPHITDVLLQVEDTPFSGLSAPLNERPIYEAAWARGQQTVRVLVQRQETERLLTVPLVRFSWRRYLDFMFAPVIISAALWLLALLLYRAAPADPTQRLGAASLALMAFLPIGVHPSLFQHDQFIDRLLSLTNVTTLAAGLLLGVTFYKFSLRFPYPLTGRAGQWGARLLTGLALLGFVAYAAARLIIYTAGMTPTAQRLESLYFYLWIGLMMASIVTAFLRMLVDAVWLRTGRRQQQEARIMLGGLLIMLPTTLLLGHYMVDSAASLSMLQVLADSRFFALALPLALAAISLRYHTFAGAQNYYFMALLLAGSGLLANVGAALLFWNRLPLIRETAVPPTFILFLLFSAAGLFLGWQASWRGWLGQVFAWERVNYQLVQQVGEALLNLHGYREADVAQKLITTLKEALQIERAAVWTAEADQLALVAQTGAWPHPPPAPLPLPAKRVVAPMRHTSAAQIWPALAQTPITAVVPLTIAGDLLGIIGVGPRWDTAVFDDRDLEILSLIGQQAALFLQNYRQLTQLREADRQMLRVLTHNRQKTAQDLHDHLLPTLSRVQFSLLASANLMDTAPQEARQTLHDSQQALAASADLVRRIQQGLITRPLEYGLRAYLINMVHQFSQETQIPVYQSLPPELDTAVRDLKLREAVHAVWQQALDNVRRHAQATEVQITLTVGDGNGRFSICDNGKGSSEMERQQALRSGSYGLRSMAIRLESVGGQLQVQSEPGRGSCISGAFPLQT